MSRYESQGFTFYFLVGFLWVVVIYAMLIWAPMHIMAESKCLAMGYPEVRTTVGLKSYCINLDGAVTNKVVPLGGE